MTTYTCPEGHASTTDDYCDVCGMPIRPGAATGTAAPAGGGGYPAATPPAPTPGVTAAPAPPAAPAEGLSSLDLDAPLPPGYGGLPTMPAPTDRTCPNCGASNLPDALYCEDCGYDFTTGQLPRPLDPPLPPVPSSGPSVPPDDAAPAPAAPSPGGPSAPAPADIPADLPGGVPGGGPADVPAAGSAPDAAAAPLAPPTADAGVTPLTPPGTDTGSDIDSDTGSDTGAGVAPDAAASDALPDAGSAVSSSDAGPDAGASAVAAGDAGAGTVPAPVLAPPVTPTSAPGHVEWVAEVWVDPDWYASQDVTDPCPSAGMPWVIPVLERTVLIGRVSVSRNIHPQIDISTDSGVSRRHAQLSSDGQRWWVEDLQSANGTYVGAAGAPLPSVPIAPGQRVELAEDDRIYLGAWSRVVVRRATPEESSLGA